MTNELDSAYLDYYNLDNDDIEAFTNGDNVEAVKQFLEQYNIKDEIISGGKLLAVEKLLNAELYFFREAFDFLTKHQAQAIEMAVEDARKRDSKSVYYGTSSFEIVLSVQNHMKRTRPALMDMEHKAGYLWRGHWCEDFLALVYLQLWVGLNSDSEHKVCPHCGEIFTTTNPRKKYCNRNCQKTAADRRRTSSPEYREYIRNFMHEYRLRSKL